MDGMPMGVQLMLVWGNVMPTVCANPAFLSDIVMPVVGASLALMVLLLALFWMAAQLFKRPEYESFVSIEIYQLIVSAVLLGVVVGFACASSQLSDSFAGGDTFEVARGYLNYMSNDLGLKTVLALEVAKEEAQYWSSLTFRWGLSVWGITVPGFPSMVLIERVVEFMLLLITPFMASLIVQMVGLEVIRGIMLPFVLPAGLVLRIFPPTRDAGAFLIAAAIGFAVVFPYTYVMHSQIVYAMISYDLQGSTEGMESLLTSGGNLEMLSFGTDFGLFDTVKVIYEPLRVMSYLLLQALFLPSLSMILTVAFIRNLSKFFSQKLG